MRAYTYMSKKEIDKSYFLTFCIEQFKRSGCTMFEAIRHLYASPLYERLADESTKLWHLGATTLYGEVGQ